MLTLYFVSVYLYLIVVSLEFDESSMLELWFLDTSLWLETLKLKAYDWVTELPVRDEEAFDWVSRESSVHFVLYLLIHTKSKL